MVVNTRFGHQGFDSSTLNTQKIKPIQLSRILQLSKILFQLFRTSSSSSTSTRITPKVFNKLLQKVVAISQDLDRHAALSVLNIVSQETLERSGRALMVNINNSTGDSSWTPLSTSQG
ncbi:hypothetical protein Adt_38381 [Abeliophyllum distichum]|uniref:Uncharacterized protein n=1 Tax=Abeliophyllum distichum TaxID=126358 RepID=A0ABD1Q2A0_9LAMI